MIFLQAGAVLHRVAVIGMNRINATYYMGKTEGEEIVGHRKVCGQGPSLCEGPAAKLKFMT